MNFERFGRHERKLPAMVGVIMLSIAVAATFVFVVSIPRYLAIGVNYGLGLYLYHSQKKHFKEFIEQGGRKASFRVPLGISLGLTILAVIGFLKLENFVKEHAQQIEDLERTEAMIASFAEYKEWKQLREAKKYDAALEIARKIYAADKLEATLSSYVMATAFWDVHKKDSAVIVLDVYLENHASDSGNYWYREIIVSYAENDSGHYERALEHLTPYVVNNADNATAWEFRSLVLRRIELQKGDPVRNANTSDELLETTARANYSDSLEYRRDAILRQVLDSSRTKERAELLKALCAEYPDYNVSIIGQAYALANTGFQDSALFIIDRYLERYGHDTYMRSHRAKLVAKMQADGL